MLRHNFLWRKPPDALDKAFEDDMQAETQAEQNERLNRIIELIDQANARDPKTAPGEDVPGELLYGRRMTEILTDLTAEPTAELRIAVRGQHIERWKIPRDDFPRDKAGYHRWRTRLAEYHESRVRELMTEVGYDSTTVERVGFLVRKKNLKTDPESAMLEDTACLVFLKYYLEEFTARHEREKIIDILRKTWKKMSENGRQAASGLELSAAMSALVGEALKPD